MRPAAAEHAGLHGVILLYVVALEADLMLKRTIPRCGLAILPKSGHVTNLEEPELFNLYALQFFTAVEHDKWNKRDPRALSTSTTSAK